MKKGRFKAPLPATPLACQRRIGYVLTGDATGARPVPALRPLMVKPS
jgi:hypothetical protein